jgi:hypothetical protein
VEIQDQYLTLSQQGEDIAPYVLDNRAMLEWRGIDLISGLIVVPPKKSVDVYYDLARWPLRTAPTVAKIEVPLTSCSDYFETEKPRVRRLRSVFGFEAKPIGNGR